MLQETNFCFLFAQKYHAAMKYVGPIRKELGFRTVFNILGPLTNPAKPEMFLLGVYDGYLVEPLAKVSCSLGGVKQGPGGLRTGKTGRKTPPTRPTHHL